MSVELTLYQKCKIVTWMEQFQSAEIVQLSFKKAFGPSSPKPSYIEALHHTFMTTGSVVGHVGNDIKVNGNSLRGINSYKRIHLVSPRQLIKKRKLDREHMEEEEEGSIIHDELEGDKNFVSIMKEEIAYEDKDFAEISVTEGEDTFVESFLPNEQRFLCTNCGFETSEKGSFDAHQRAHAVKDFFHCASCSFTSNSTSLLRNHKKICTGKDIDKEDGIEKPQDVAKLDQDIHTCDQCGKAYSSFASLKMHQAYHSKLRPLACTKCDYRFFTDTALQKHLLTHDKIKHLECPHCSFKCSMSGNMIIHLRTHTGEKPYKCEVCPYRTGNPSVFRRHVGCHRNEFKYRCHQCNYCTHKSSLLANHEKMHSGTKLKCHLCQKEMRNFYSLRYHLKKQHSEQEKLECPFCDFTQNSRSMLMIHIRKHTGEKPHGCPRRNCNFRAMRSQDLKKHITNAH